MTDKSSNRSFRETAKFVVADRIRLSRMAGLIPSQGALDEKQFKKLFEEIQRDYPWKGQYHHELYLLWCEERDRLILPLRGDWAKPPEPLPTEQLKLF